jgi:hypothetical protein
MSKFALIEIEAVNGKQKFLKLLKDEKCEFDDFELEASKNFKLEMNSLYHRMDLFSMGEKLPITQFRILKGSNKVFTECEIKTKHLRVYFIIDNSIRNIVIIGGYKTKQIKDINHFRNIIGEYIKFKDN